jgi:hypothetical protein
MKLYFAISAVRRNLPHSPEDRHPDLSPDLSRDIKQDPSRDISKDHM